MIDKALVINSKYICNIKQVLYIIMEVHPSK